jgi:phage regulator Rha-like protein
MEKNNFLFLTYLFAFQIGLTIAGSNIEQITAKIVQDAKKLRTEMEEGAKTPGVADDLKKTIDEAAENIEAAAKDELKDTLDDNCEC